MTDKHSTFDELDINELALFHFNGIDPTVRRSTSALILQALLLAKT